MNNLDKITRDAKLLVDSARDAANTNIVKAAMDKKLNLNEYQIQEVLNLINASFDEGYQRAITVFQNTIKKHL
jgi:hypothetical protein